MSERHEAVVAEIRAALDRLKTGKPERVSPNYRLGVSAVCREAGISRVTLYKRYSELLPEIHDACSGVPQVNSKGKRRNEAQLRHDLAEARAQIRMALSENAALLHRALEAEKALDAARKSAPLVVLKR